MIEKSQYKNFGEWRKACPKNYESARYQGFLKEVCERFGWEIPKRKVHLSPEKTFQTCVDNKLTGGIKYKKYRSENKELKLPSMPWEIKKETCAEYFKRVKAELGIDELLSTEETFKLCVDNKLTSNKKYNKYRSENKHLNLHSVPWATTEESCADYFNRVRDELGLTKLLPEKTFKICIDNKLTSNREYRKYRKEKNHLNLWSDPWKFEKETSTDYFKRVKVELGIDELLSPGETFKVCIDNKLTSTPKYIKYRNDNKYLKLHSDPWKVIKETSGDYFKRVKVELGINDELLSPGETFKVCIDNELIHGIKYREYRNDNKYLKLHSDPWKVIKETSGDYFKRVKIELGV